MVKFYISPKTVEITTINSRNNQKSYLNSLLCAFAGNILKPLFPAKSVCEEESSVFKAIQNSKPKI